MTGMGGGPSSPSSILRRTPGHMGSLGPYQILEVIGRGGMGVVLKGSDPALARVVAIKVLAPELSFLGSARLRFAREARAAASVAHDHVVAIHAVDSWKGLPYLVMQYVPGKSLQARIERDGPLAVREVLRIGMQVASGLAAAHAQGLVHRDIKPANILLENGIERVKITDFGLARAADDASISQSGVAAGTPHYMAPEQARCEPIDPRVDLFGLGGVMYAMCTGHPPFRAETAMAVLRRVCEDTPRSIRADHPEVPAWLEAIIAKLLAKDPAARFQTAAEVAELLGQCLVYLERPTDAPPFPYEADHSCFPAWRGGGGSRRPWLLALVAGLGVTEAGGLTGISGLPRDGFSRQERSEQAACRSGRSSRCCVPSRLPAAIRSRPGRSGPSAPRLIRPTEPNWPSAAPTDSSRSAPLAHTGFARSSRHPDRVFSVAYSPDGKTLAVAGGDWERGTKKGFVRLWDAATGRELATLAQGCDIEFAVAFSPDGKTLAWCGRDRTVTLWDVDLGRVRATCVGHEGTVRALAFHPGGHRLVSAGFDGTIRFWNTATGVEDGEPIRLAGRSSNFVAFSPDGASLAFNTGPRSDDPGLGPSRTGLAPDLGLEHPEGTANPRGTPLPHPRRVVLSRRKNPGLGGGPLLLTAPRSRCGTSRRAGNASASRDISGGWNAWRSRPTPAFWSAPAGFEKNPGEVRVWDLSSPGSPGTTKRRCMTPGDQGEVRPGVRCTSYESKRGIMCRLFFFLSVLGPSSRQLARRARRSTSTSPGRVTTAGCSAPRRGSTAGAGTPGATAFTPPCRKGQPSRGPLRFRGLMRLEGDFEIVADFTFSGFPGLPSRPRAVRSRTRATTSRSSCMPRSDGDGLSGPPAVGRGLGLLRELTPRGFDAPPLSGRGEVRPAGRPALGGSAHVSALGRCRHTRRDGNGQVQHRADRRSRAPGAGAAEPRRDRSPFRPAVDQGGQDRQAPRAAVHRLGPWSLADAGSGRRCIRWRLGCLEITGVAAKSGRSRKPPLKPAVTSATRTAAKPAAAEAEVVGSRSSSSWS